LPEVGSKLWIAEPSRRPTCPAYIITSCLPSETIVLAPAISEVGRKMRYDEFTSALGGVRTTPNAESASQPWTSGKRSW
jgi:hypothetical protein